MLFLRPQLVYKMYFVTVERGRDRSSDSERKSAHFTRTNLTIVDANFHRLELCASYASFCLNFPNTERHRQCLTIVNKLRREMRRCSAFHR